MKKFSRNMIALSFLLLGVFVVGCSNADSPTGTQAMNTAGSSLMIVDDITTDALLSNGYDLNHPDFAELGDRASRDSKDVNRQDARRDHLRAILPCLELTAEQQRAMRELLNAHRDCVKSVVEASRSAAKSIKEQLDATRQRIKAAVADGSMSREEGNAAMQAANEQARAELQAIKTRMMAAMEDCKIKLYRGIAGMLNDTQLAIWNNWLATGEIPCKRDRRTPTDSVRTRP